MARGTQHRKRRPTANARSGARPAAVASAPRKQKPPQWQEELFFARLRVHAKWMFLGLAIVFALGFVVFGVGSGSTGISDALQNAFHFGGGGGTSISKLEKKVAQHPNDAAAWRSLATAYEQKQRTADAVNALNRVVALQPRNQDALSELAAEQTQLVSTYQTDYQNELAAAQLAAPNIAFQPPSSTPLGRAYSDPNALQDPMEAAAQQIAGQKVQAAQAKLLGAQAAAESAWKRLAAVTPNDATTQLQLGQAAQSAGDTATAASAYKRFLVLAPHDPLAPQVKKVLKSIGQPSG